LSLIEFIVLEELFHAALDLQLIHIASVDNTIIVIELAFSILAYSNIIILLFTSPLMIFDCSSKLEMSQEITEHLPWFTQDLVHAKYINNFPLRIQNPFQIVKYCIPLSKKCCLFSCFLSFNFIRSNISLNFATISTLSWSYWW